MMRTNFLLSVIAAGIWLHLLVAVSTPVAAQDELERERRLIQERLAKYDQQQQELQQQTQTAILKTLRDLEIAAQQSRLAVEQIASGSCANRRLC